jgi:hypothetical protein
MSLRNCRTRNDAPTRCGADRLLDRVCVVPGVLTTDYASLCGYFLRHDVLRGWLDICARVDAGDAGRMLDLLGLVLRELFLIRATGYRLGGQLSWVPLKSGLSADARRKGHIDRFDLSDYLTRLLSKNRRTAPRATFEQTMEELRGLGPRDIRHVCNDHDFFRLLTIYVRAHSSQRWLHDEDAIRGSLTIALRMEALVPELLFLTMLSRASTPSPTARQLPART